MSNTILPNAISLVSMSDDELREELLKDIYNPANLREMIRKLIKLTMEYAKIVDYRKEEILEYKQTIEKIRDAINQFGWEG